MNTGDSLEKIKEIEAKKELIKKSLKAWFEIFGRHSSIMIDECVQELEQGLYEVGDRYPLRSKGSDYNPTESYISGVRLQYDDRRQGMCLYANDYAGDPAPLLIQLAEDLKDRGVKIVYIQRQFSYNPPNPEVTDSAIKQFNESHK